MSFDVFSCFIETSWEAGLREAREALRRAKMVRQEPDFDKKRLVAVPVGERRPHGDTDSENTPTRYV